MKQDNHAITNPPPIFPTHLGFDSHEMWIGGDLLSHIITRINIAKANEASPDIPSPGMFEVNLFLVALQRLTGLRLRLILGPVDKPIHALNLSKLDCDFGVFTDDEIDEWVRAGASLIADARDLCDSGLN